MEATDRERKTQAVGDSIGVADSVLNPVYITSSDRIDLYWREVWRTERGIAYRLTPPCTELVVLGSVCAESALTPDLLKAG